MTTTLTLVRRNSLAATGGLVALGALLTENLLLVALMFDPGAPALRAVAEALFKAVVVVMMHNWPALLAAAFGVLLLVYLGISSLQVPQSVPEDGR